MKSECEKKDPLISQNGTFFFNLISQNGTFFFQPNFNY